MTKLVDKLFQPVDNASLVVMRLFFGAIMFWEVWRYIGYGWIKPSFLDPKFHFPFPWFAWLSPLPGSGMYMLFFLLGILSILIVIGLWYRVSAALFFVGFTYVFLLDQSYYLNHFYLLSLLSFLMIFIPAHRDLSFDSRNNPGLRSTKAPAWALWLLRFQIALPYFFGGVAKINEDWLIRLEPIGTWLKQRADFPVIGAWLGGDSAAYLFSWGGTIFDLLIVPFLLWPRTRKVAFVAAVMFHIMNARLFQIGIFPWFMICASTIYFDPDWPRRTRFWPKDKPQQTKTSRTPKAGKAARVPLPSDSAAGEPLVPAQRRKLVAALLAAYAAVQIFLPLRHFLYPGDPSWTSEGHLFSWRMKLTRKVGSARLMLTDPSDNRAWELDVRDLLGVRQGTVMTDPQLLHQLAHLVAREYREQGHERVEVRADVAVDLNASASRVLINPEVDLAAEPVNLWPAKWIYPHDQAPAAAQSGGGSASPTETAEW